MKIAHIGTSCMPIRLGHGGAVERRILELSRAQAELGEDVRVLSAEGMPRRWTADAVRYEAVKVTLARPYRDYEFLVKAYGPLSADPPDIIHAHNAPDIGRLAQRLKIPAVYTFDYFRLGATRWRLGRAYYRRSLGAYARLLPVSDACGREFTEFWNPAPGPMSVFYNGVNLDQFHPTAEAARSLRAKLGIGTRPVVLYVGRVCEQKGADVLLDAWEMTRRRHPDAVLVFAGPVQLFTNSATGSPLTRRLQHMDGRYLGAVSDDELNSVYNIGDVFVMPTRQDEMFGMAALEAQACGKPVVASRLGGLCESVGASSGAFCTPGAADEFDSALCLLLESAERRAQMGAAAVEHARRFSWSRLATESLGLYRSVLSQADRGQDDGGNVSGPRGNRTSHAG
jgi:glycosyltransferase involved in cell wall biosynthesis